MSSNIVNQVAYLRTSREYPNELHQLSVESNKAYIDIAAAVNSSIDGIFAANRPAITRESWFISSSLRQQTLRQVYQVTTANVSTGINHMITNVIPGQFVRCFGSYTDGINTFGLIFGTSVLLAGEITFYITPTQIVFLQGAGAPALTSGIVVLEWLSRI